MVLTPTQTGPEVDGRQMRRNIDMTHGREMPELDDTNEIPELPKFHGGLSKTQTGHRGIIAHLWTSNTASNGSWWV